MQELRLLQSHPLGRQEPQHPGCLQGPPTGFYFLPSSPTPPPEKPRSPFSNINKVMRAAPKLSTARSLPPPQPHHLLLLHGHTEFTSNPGLLHLQTQCPGSSAQRSSLR